ncbi:MAG: hypothetical protein KKF56_03610 [Nanoarchaeota archaeon]|nr:hypothetical protein [Nanoarchaeota archaeon]
MSTDGRYREMYRQVNDSGSMGETVRRLRARRLLMAEERTVETEEPFPFDNVDTGHAGNGHTYVRVNGHFHRV